MKEETRKYEKEGTVIPVYVYVCDCGGSIRYVGGAGCAHDDNWTYFWQCNTCKNVYEGELLPGKDEEEFIEADWKLVI